MRASPTIVSDQTPAPDRIVCGCLDIRHCDIEFCQSQGMSTADAVAASSGATSHCGSCTQMLTTIVGDPGGTPSSVELDHIGLDLLLLTLRPLDGGEFLQRHEPGEHVVFSIETDAGWVSRPYTITSSPEQTDRRLLLVRCLPNGRMGQALMKYRKKVRARVGTPRGDAFARLRRRRATAFLVAGVGLTPALAALRAKNGPPVAFVHASFRDREPGPERLLAQACWERKSPIIVLNCNEVGMQAAADFAELARKHPGIDWFICGPDGYEAAVRQGLRDAGVPSARVHAEQFVASSSIDDPAPARLRTHAEKRWAATGLWLSAAWCLWVVLPGAEVWSRWQSSDAWRATTGMLLMAVIAWQWVFPSLRGRGLFQSARRLELWHRAIGALSPVALLLHQRDLAHGLLTFLSALFILNTVLGSLDKTVVANPLKRERYMKLWLPAHVAASCLVTALGVWHVIMVIAFRGGQT